MNEGFISSDKSKYLSLVILSMSQAQNSSGVSLFDTSAERYSDTIWLVVDSNFASASATTTELSLSRFFKRGTSLSPKYVLRRGKSAKEDKMGKALQDLSLKTRERASKKE